MVHVGFRSVLESHWCESVLAVKALTFEPVGTGLFMVMVMIVSTGVFVVGIKIVAMVMVATVRGPGMFFVVRALMLMR